ncbi:MAG: hypothetical protein WA840_11785 [Caulobacteraceae bacterium]
MRLGRDLLVLGFGDLAAPSAPQLQTLTAVAPPDATCVLADVDWPAADTAQLDALAAIAQSKPWLICMGVGAGGYGALYFGRMLGASAIFAAAPGGGHGRPVSVEDLDDLAALYADPDLETPDQLLQVVTADDSRPMDLALLDRLRGVGADVVVDHAALPSSAVAVALTQSGVWADQLAAWQAGEPALAAGDVATLWRQAFAHALEIDVAAAYQDADGALLLSGRLYNQSPTTFDLAMASSEQVRVGARLRSRAGAGHVLAEARAGFSMTHLAPGQSSPFRLRFPSLPEKADTLDVGLVCDSRFWFDAVGFPVTAFSLGAQVDPIPEGDDQDTVPAGAT